jgi:hypothetical protein
MILFITMILMAMTLQEFFVGQYVYAQENTITLNPCELADDGTVWNTGTQSCFQSCPNGYVQS